jgi:hypothetical protein
MPAGDPHKRKKEFTAQVPAARACGENNKFIDNARRPAILSTPLRPSPEIECSTPAIVF